MKAIILAAGRGSRMGAMTNHAPKCLTVFQGKSLLQWQLDALRGNGIKDIALVCGYQKEMLPAKFVKFENTNWQKSNMVSSLICADEWLRQSPCIVSYSDIVYSTNVVTKLSESHSDIAISYDKNWEALWRARYTDPREDAESFKQQNNRLVEIGGQIDETANVNGQYMGLLKFTPEGWKEISHYLNSISQALIDKLDMTSLLQHLINKGVTIETVQNDMPWYEIDNLNDLKVCETLPPVQI